MKQLGAYLPRSTSTIWSILDRHQRLYRYQRPQPEPEERPDPLTHVQIDFKSVGSVPADPEGKKMHVVETLNIVDKGSSILLTATPREDYNAETVITTMVDAFEANGLPDVVTFDRDQTLHWLPGRAMIPLNECIFIGSVGRAHIDTQPQTHEKAHEWGRELFGRPGAS